MEDPSRVSWLCHKLSGAGRPPASSRDRDRKAIGCFHQAGAQPNNVWRCTAVQSMDGACSEISLDLEEK